MGNDKKHHRTNKKSHLQSSTESMEDMDTSGNIVSPYLFSHTYKADCPHCSGLCSLRSPPRGPPGSSSGGARREFSVDRPMHDYAGIPKDNRGAYGADITPAGRPSSKLMERYNPSASDYGGACGTTCNGRSVAPPPSNIGVYGLGDASSTFNTVGDPFKLPMSSIGIYGIGNTGPYKSSYEAGYDEGLKMGYAIALMDFRAHGVNATNGNGSEGRDLALENGDASGGSDDGVGAGSIGVGNQLNHSQNNSNDNSSSREIVLRTSTAGQTAQSNVQRSASYTNRADKETTPHNTERAEEHSTSSFPSRSDRHAPTEEWFGLTEADKATILDGAAKLGKFSGSSSSTHSNHNNTEGFNSVRPKSRSTSCNGPETGKESSLRNLRLAFTGKGSSRSTNGGANEFEASRKDHNNLYPSLEGFRGVCSQRQNKFRKKPASQQEKLLADYTTEVFHQRLSGVASSSGNNTAAAPPDCSICITSLAEDSPYLKASDVSRDLVGCAALKRCGHHFHISCLRQMATHDASWLTCPNCQTIHGVRIGTQPKGGQMGTRKYGGNLPGFPPSSGTIEISYSFRPGKQGPEHPNPGRPYRLVGFPRVAYLPDTAQGNKVLKLLRVAFERRLIFTVGTSATLGSSDCVVWNGIHHKTETYDSSGHGYPDPKYLDNVMMELASFGVT